MCIRDRYRALYFQVLIAIVIGITLGYFYPELGEKMKPLGDGFINLIKMIIAPVIFITITVGTVSYTHLDVYKRQDCQLANGRFIDRRNPLGNSW